MNVLVTGGSGLIGSEAVEYYVKQGHTVYDIDNNMRKEFFGIPGDTTWNLNRLKSVTKNFKHYDIDILLLVTSHRDGHSLCGATVPRSTGRHSIR